MEMRFPAEVRRLMWMLLGVQAIIAMQKFEADQAKEKEEQKKKILEEYGAEKFMKSADSRLRFGATENWVGTRSTSRTDGGWNPHYLMLACRWSIAGMGG
jgi:hypothetical protein